MEEVLKLERAWMAEKYNARAMLLISQRLLFLETLNLRILNFARK